MGEFAFMTLGNIAVSASLWIYLIFINSIRYFKRELRMANDQLNVIETAGLKRTLGASVSDSVITWDHTKKIAIHYMPREQGIVLQVSDWFKAIYCTREGISLQSIHLDDRAKKLVSKDEELKGFCVLCAETFEKNMLKNNEM